VGRVVFVRKFIPLSVAFGQISRSVELDAALNKLDDSLNKLFMELTGIVGDRRIIQLGLSINGLSVGNVNGILAVAYALVED